MHGGDRFLVAGYRVVSQQGIPGFEKSGMLRVPNSNSSMRQA